MDLDQTELAKLLPEGAAVDEEAPYLVLADWLQTQGHPWGELIVLQQRLANAKKHVKEEIEQSLETLLEEHGEELLGSTSQHHATNFEWHLGFVRSATLGFDPKLPLEPVVEDFLARPIASQVRTLVLSPAIRQMNTVSDWGDTDANIVAPFEDLAVIAKHVPERVTKLGLGMSPPNASAAYIRMPAFWAVSAAFPKLARLELTGWPAEEPGALALPALRELVVKAGQIDDATLTAITDSELPKLERLTISFGGNSNCVLDDIFGGGDDEDDEGEVSYDETFSARALESLNVYSMSSATSADALTTFLAALPGGLRHLGLQSLVFEDGVLAAIAEWPGLAKLASLDLSGGTLATPDELVRAKSSFAHLTTLDLERNLLDAAAVKKMHTALPHAKLDDQRKLGSDGVAAPELFTRYVATME